MSWPRFTVGAFFLTAIILFVAAILSPLLTPPATPGAETIQLLTIVVTVLGLGIGIFVFVLLVYVVWKFRAGPGRPDLRVPNPKTNDHRLEFWWTLIPSVILAAIFFASWVVIFEIDRPTNASSADYTIEIVGHQWQWEFRYPDNTSSFDTLYVEQGRFYRLNITSVDVIHSFFVPAFAIKTDANPGRVNVAYLDARDAGTFRGQCAEFCGTAHSGMLLTVVVFPEDPDRDFGPPPVFTPPTGTQYDVTLSDAGTTLSKGGVAVTGFEADILERLLLNVTNTGGLDHDLTLAPPWDRTTGPVAPGSRVWLNFTVNWTAGTTYNSSLDAAAGFAGTATITTDLSLVRDLELSDAFAPGGSWRISPAGLRLARGETVYLRVWNNGSTPHNLYLGEGEGVDARIDAVWNAGEYRWLVLTAPHEDVTASYWCNVPGHRENGMVGTVIVGRGSPPNPNLYPDSWLWFIVAATGLLVLFGAYGIRYHLRHADFDDTPRDRGPEV